MKNVMLEFDTIYTEKIFKISQIFLYNHDQSLSMFPSILSKMEVIILKVQIFVLSKVCHVYEISTQSTQTTIKYT